MHRPDSVPAGSPMPHYTPTSIESRSGHERSQAIQRPYSESRSSEESSAYGSIPTPLMQPPPMLAPSASMNGSTDSGSRNDLSLDAESFDNGRHMQHPSNATFAEHINDKGKRIRPEATGYNEDLVDQFGDGPSKRTFKKRSHAKRTCQKCQRLKARCVLPDVNVYSSEAPLPANLSCERCAKRGAACIVNDRRGPRAPPPGYQVLGQTAMRPTSSSNNGQASTSTTTGPEQHPAEHFADSARSSMFPGQDDVIWHRLGDEAAHEHDDTAAEAEGEDRQQTPLLTPASQVFVVVRPLALFAHLVNGIISKSSDDFEIKFGSARCTYVLDSGLTPFLLDMIDQK
ncbi:unnamed protein product [Tilletia caries]|nr:unnamed protein product [Tilletia caries]